MQGHMIASLIVLNVALSSIFYFAYSYCFAQVEAAAKGAKADAALMKAISSTHELMTLIFISAVVFISGLLFIIGLRYSNRVAGPIYHLNKYLKDRMIGQAKRKVVFRDSDYFQELAETTNLFLEWQENQKPTEAKAEIKKAS